MVFAWHGRQNTENYKNPLQMSMMWVNIWCVNILCTLWFTVIVPDNLVLANVGPAYRVAKELEGVVKIWSVPNIPGPENDIQYYEWCSSK